MDACLLCFDSLLVRHVSEGTAAVRSEGWKQRSTLIGCELYGKTLAILGLGRIGREVAARMQAFRMKVLLSSLIPVRPS